MMNDQSLGLPPLRAQELMAPDAVTLQAESSLSDVAATFAEIAALTGHDPENGRPRLTRDAQTGARNVNSAKQHRLGGSQ